MSSSSSDSDASSSASESLSIFFKPKKFKNQTFYFRSILFDTINDASGIKTKVTFVYNYAMDVDLESSVTFPGVMDSSYYNCILAIGMCQAMWFWMGFGTQTIMVNQDLGVQSEHMPFWSELFNNVLLEYLYVNKMKFSIELMIGPMPEEWSPFVRPEFEHNHTMISEISVHQNSRVLVPLGGGKDSIVAWDRCKDEGYEPVMLYIENEIDEAKKNTMVQKVLENMNEQTIIMTHDFHSTVFDHRCRSSVQLCGHPWAALVLFDSVLIAQLCHANDIYLGFEKSADEGNGIFWLGREVNHQYDKSSVFLSRAMSFIDQYLGLSQPLRVQSPLMSMWEIEISQIFCRKPSLKRFHNCFLSCNSPIDYCKWCNRCEKCLFINMLMSAWLSPDEVNTIFGESLWGQVGENMDHFIKNTYLSLIGQLEGGHKPFECVGTENEAKCALHLTLLRYFESMTLKGQITATTTTAKEFLALLPSILRYAALHLHTIDFDDSKWHLKMNEQNILKLYTE